MHTSIFKNDGQTVSFTSAGSYNLPYCHLHNHNELLFLMSGKLHLENNLDTVDIIDFNMGCPATKVVKNGDGSKLLEDLDKLE